MSNPCLCIARSIYTPPVSACPNPDNCIQVCDTIIYPADGVGPCGQSPLAPVDMMDESLGHNFTACGENTPTWKVIDWDKTILANVSITPAGLLTWVTGPGSTAGKVGQVLLYVCCGLYSYYARVWIGVKDLCNCPECPACENCNPCNGECLDLVVNVSVTATAS